MKLVIDKAIPFIKGRLPEEVEVILADGKAIDAGMVKDADALVVRTRTHCDEKLLKGSNVRLIATATIGTDHIDIPWCEQNGIKVSSAPGCNAPGVAQYVLASILKTGFDTHKDILGIIGYGHVGQIVASWARKTGFSVLVCDPPRKAAGFDDIEYFPLEDLLAKCSAITLHVPLTKTGNFPTYHLIGEKELEMMRNGCVLINSSRGGVVDESSLKNAIDKKGLKAIIDVWENEPDIDKELVSKSFISTPHIAGYSSEGKKRATGMALKAVGKFFDMAIDLKGLECALNTERYITKEQIEKSYDPLIDSNNLRQDISKFEELRNNYSYRHEPHFHTLQNS